jgi:predicted transcriptional regulator YdeE
MNSRLPFFLAWMKKMMEAFVGMDYKRGLLMLQEYAEKGKVNSVLTFKGIQTFDSCIYVGIDRTCQVSQIPDFMKTDYTRLLEYMHGNHKEKIAGPTFSIYKKWNPVKDQVVYTACVPVTVSLPNLEEGMLMGDVPATKVHSVEHKGSYKYSGNIWSALYSMSRAKVFKQNKKLSPMEIYHNSPKDTPENELISEVVFPIK